MGHTSLRGPTFREDHAVERSVELDVHSHVCLLALHLQVFDLWHVWGRQGPRVVASSDASTVGRPVCWWWG